MKIIFLIFSTAVGWWSSRNDEWFVQAGVITVCVVLAVLVLALFGIVRAITLGQPMRAMPFRWNRRFVQDTDVEYEQAKIEWVPVKGSPEDPLRNPWYTPDHQSPIDPDRWH